MSLRRLQKLEEVVEKRNKKYFNYFNPSYKEEKNNLVKANRKRLKRHKKKFAKVKETK